MVRFFSSDPQVVAVGEEYLRIVSWSFIASGITFVGSSMFQALGNTLPPLGTSVLRLVLVGLPLLWLAPQPGFSLRWIWYLSVLSVTLQMVVNLLLLHREFRLRFGLVRAVPAI
jgi:Na+-driven multidrug efflux pump